jgi:hypothetical protein
VTSDEGRLVSTEEKRTIVWYYKPIDEAVQYLKDIRK